MFVFVIGAVAIPPSKLLVRYCSQGPAVNICFEKIQCRSKTFKVDELRKTRQMTGHLIKKNAVKE